MKHRNKVRLPSNINWLATQCQSNLSPNKFPANREFYSETDDFGGSETGSMAKKRCCGDFWLNSLFQITGK